MIYDLSDQDPPPTVDIFVLIEFDPCIYCNLVDNQCLFSCSIVHCALCIVHRALCIVHCALCIVHCALCIVHCALCIVHPLLLVFLIFYTRALSR